MWTIEPTNNKEKNISPTFAKQTNMAVRINKTLALHQ
jgi:hypothetical protein